MRARIGLTICNGFQLQKIGVKMWIEYTSFTLARWSICGAAVIEDRLLNFDRSKNKSSGRTGTILFILRNL